jgi:predicted RecB family endonuclease
MICPHCHRSIAAKKPDPAHLERLNQLAKIAKERSIAVAAAQAGMTVAALYSQLNRAGIRLKGKK